MGWKCPDCTELRRTLVNERKEYGTDLLALVRYTNALEIALEEARYYMRDEIRRTRKDFTDHGWMYDDLRLYVRARLVRMALSERVKRMLEDVRG